MGAIDLGDAKARLEICRACEHHKDVGPSVWCKICKCNMNAKTLLGPLLGMSCPQGKW